MVIDNPYDEFIPLESRPWWDRNDEKMSYSSYQVGATTVYVGKRPDLYGMNHETYRKFNSFINVSDRYIQHESGKINSFHAWIEGSPPSAENVFSVLKTLDYQIRELKYKNIYIHCDLGTHRAPTMFGLYLLAYHVDEANQISNSHQDVDRPQWSDPLSYAWNYMSANKTRHYLPVMIDRIKTQAIDSPQRGISLNEEFFSKNLTEAQKYHMNVDLMISNHSSRTWPILWEVITYSYFTKITKLKIWWHKVRNTEKGKFYKKNNF